jgi:hypothetical protein
MKKEQAKRMMSEVDEKNYERLVVKMAEMEKKRAKHERDKAREAKQRHSQQRQKFDKVLQNHKELQYSQSLVRKNEQELLLKKNQSVTSPEPFSPMGLKTISGGGFTKT